MLSGPGPPLVLATVIIPPGQYTELTFVQALDSQLNETTFGNVRAEYDSSTNVCSLYTPNENGTFQVFTDDELQASWSVAEIQAPWGGTQITTINEILNNIITPSPKYDYNNRMIINRLSLQPIHSVYITSPNLGCYDTISHFSDNIIKQVPVTADYGYMIVDQLVSFADGLNCSGQTLKTIQFNLRDQRGRFVNMYNNHVSFTIVFDLLRD